MEIVEKLQDHSCWNEFLNYKVSRGDMRKQDRDDLIRFVSEREYSVLVESIIEGREMGLPKLLEVNKNGVKKKRVVFSYGREENYTLKMLAYLLKEYDYLFYDNLFSFRSEMGVKKAIGKTIGKIDIKTAYSYKVDIHDYFNSIQTDEMLALIKKYMPEEDWLYGFFEKMLRNPFAIKNEKIIQVTKGVMAGTPTAGFLANLYLSDLDRYFWEKDIVYARYSDDIIVFSDKKESIEEYETEVKTRLRNKGLEVNPLKENKTLPGDKIEFLGFEFSNNEINISDMTEKKIKAKIRRKARALYRWKIRKKAADDRTAHALIRFLNNMFYNNSVKGEITWCRWYFPLLTNDDKLHRIDEYAIQNIRYLYTGRYGKKNYDVQYEKIKSMGYRSLVNSFWKYKSGKFEV